MLTLRCPCQSRLRHGASLLEILVVLGVLLALMALLAPAIHSARETARSLDCQHRLKNLGLAVHGFHGQRQGLPQIMIGERSEFPSTFSVWVQLLPFLDQAQLYAEVESALGNRSGRSAASVSPSVRPRSVRVPALECPSASLADGGCSYRVCTGPLPSLLAPARLRPSARHRGVFHSVGPTFASPQWSYVTDGLSQTVMFSEKLTGDLDPMRYTPSGDVYYVPYRSISEPDEFAALCQSSFPVVTPSHWSLGGSTWLYHGYGYTWYNHTSSPNSAIPDCTTSGDSPSQGVYSARSWHPGLVHAAMADGAVKSVAESIDLDLWRALGSRGGGERISSY